MGTETAKATDINVLELLLKISNDVSSIKTDLVNFKDSQAKDKADTEKDIQAVRDDLSRKIKELESSTQARINSIQSVQNNLVGEIDTLKHAGEKEDAHKWKVITSFILTAIGGMFLAKLPDIVSYLVLSAKLKG